MLMTGRVGLSRNGITVSVEHFPYRKKPALAVYIEKENRAYKVASFNSEETADWFLELMEEMWGSNEKTKGTAE